VATLKEQNIGVVFEGIGGIAKGLYKNNDKLSTIIRTRRVYLLKTTSIKSRLYDEAREASASLAIESKDIARV
jgi:3-oxoacyl-[acyl-carrier-protein] synthase III